MSWVTEFTEEELRALGEKRTLPRLLPIPLAAIGMVCVGEGLLGDHPLVLASATLWTACMLFCWTSAFHETAHQTLWKSPLLSIWSGRLLGIVLFVPYSVYRQVHIRHHAYLNQPDDWELWPYSSPQASLAFRRVFVWFDLVFGPIAAAYVYGRLYLHRDSPMNDPQLRKTIRNEYLCMALFWGTVWTVNTLMGLWTEHVRSVLLPIWIAGILQTGRKFTEHLGMASFDPLLGTRTVLPHKWLLRLSSFLNFDIYIHGPHHRHPRVAHTSLEEKMQQYRAKNPHIEFPVYRRYWQAILAMAPWLVKNPGCGVNVAQGLPSVSRTRAVDDFVGDVVTDVLLQPEPTGATASTG